MTATGIAGERREIRMAGARVGSLAGLWRFPVKSMRGERLGQCELTARGLLGDRAFALIDVETGNVVSAKNVKQFPGVLNLRATFVESPRVDRDLPEVQIELQDGRVVASGSADANRALSAYFQRDVRLARYAPELTVDQNQLDIEDGERGLPSPGPVGGFVDLFSISVLTISTLERLSAIRPHSRFDQRRFRMNLIVGTSAPGFVENDWIGGQLTIGDAARIRVALPDPRCAMTTLAQEDLPGDADILRTLVHHNQRDVPGLGPVPCAGVYAVVEAPGTLQLADAVALAAGHS